MRKSEMSASFYSISGSDYKRPEYPATRDVGESMSARLTAGAVYAVSLPPDASEADQSARVSFRSIVDASNCANAGGQEIINGYVTLAKKAGAFFKDYMY